MAYYAALTSLLEILDQIPQPQQQITYLQCRCEGLRRLLLILDHSPLKSSSTVKILEGRIRDASYEAEDVIQSQISRQVPSKSLSRRVSNFVRKMIRSVEYLPRLEFLGFENIIDEFDSILDDLSDKIKDGRVEDLPPKNSSIVGSSRFVASDKSTVVGLEEDLLQLKDRLTGSSSELDIISIVGTGGIDKTTLAKNLYDDSLIQHHFDTRAWIVVSQEYHLRKMFTGLLDSTRHGVGELHKKNIEELAELLYKSLKGRRYLIVMDDVWDTKAWDDVRRFFPDDNNGSRIVLTTRLSEVAMYAGSYGPIHHMNLLSSEESWNLLRQKLFGEESCPLKLEMIGKKIAENCKGLPLAIIVISGLLYKGSKTQDYWQYIAENVKSAVTENCDQFMEILSLSYNSLPHHLKSCFLYMGSFPEDDEILVSKLTKLWIAEGFMRREVHRSLEEVAKDYLKDLIDRSLVMVRKQDDIRTRKTRIVIHDMWRELCIKKAQDENFLQLLNSNNCHFPQGKNNQRRVSIHSAVLCLNIPHVQPSLVRSLLYFDYFCYFKQLSRRILPISMSCKLLRVLDVMAIAFFKFPMQILDLIHLRYLALCYMDKNKSKSKSKFPASISKLQNFQTLIVTRRNVYESSSDAILYLPSSIWEMPQLRHIFFDISFLPAPITRKDSIVLENLQTLLGVTSFRCTQRRLNL